MNGLTGLQILQREDRQLAGHTVHGVSIAGRLVVVYNFHDCAVGILHAGVVAANGADLQIGIIVLKALDHSHRIRCGLHIVCGRPGTVRGSFGCIERGKGLALILIDDHFKIVGVVVGIHKGTVFHLAADGLLLGDRAFSQGVALAALVVNGYSIHGLIAADQGNTVRFVVDDLLPVLIGRIQLQHAGGVCFRVAPHQIGAVGGDRAGQVQSSFFFAGAVGQLCAGEVDGLIGGIIELDKAVADGTFTLVTAAVDLADDDAVQIG